MSAPLNTPLHLPAPETVTDIDGNIYKTVTIGSQVWLTENLRTTRAKDGTKLTYFYYNFDASNINKYGFLYTKPAAEKACPCDWHLPTRDEWLELIEYIGEAGFIEKEGKALKANYGWGNNYNGNDDFGFSALPGGLRTAGQWPSFEDAGKIASWWTDFASFQMHYNSSEVLFVNSFIGGIENTGLSVRCVWDNNILPIVRTIAVKDITQTSAISESEVTHHGWDAVTARGVVFGTSIKPSLESNFGITIDGVLTGSFNSKLTRLLPNTTYYIRAYATNSSGTKYGNQIVFTTK
jgi:uncharacterized protein (TIGR02145 family)